MIKARFYLDKRQADKDGLYTLYLAVSKNGTSSMSACGIKLSKEQWDGKAVIKHPRKDFLNKYLSAKMGDVNKVILELSYNGAFVHKTAKDCLDLILERLDPEKFLIREEAAKKQALAINGFSSRFMMVVDGKTKPGTKKLYRDTYNKICAFCKDAGTDITLLTFDEIKKPWLESFEQFCLRTEKQNTASRHLRDIRKVFNDAIDDGITTNYPFRKFKIKKEESKDKSYTAEELRRLFAFKSTVPGEQESIDIFKLMFCLIGINSVDLAYCGKPTKGKIDYIRRKTGKSYSVKLEPEANAIIKKYIGKEHLVNILERVPNYKTYFRRMDKNLKKIGKAQVPGKASTGKALFPEISSGSARTSWATIAQEELEIPREVIAAALGHHTVDVTSTYLRTDWRKKVAEANRKVLDWVFYGKKE